MIKRNNWYRTCLIFSMFLGGCNLMAQRSSLLIADFEHQKEVEALPSDMELIFQSGFEGNTKIVSRGVDDDIVGSDPNLPKSDWDALKRDIMSIVYFNYTGGDASKRYARIVDDPTNPKNKILHFWLNDYWLASENQEKARVQLEFHGIKGGFKELYQSVRVYLPEDFNTVKEYPKALGWLTIAEFWNNEWWSAGEEHGLRMSMGIGKDAGTVEHLFITLGSENAGFKEVWNATNPTVKVPVCKWFTLEYYIKEGNADNGRFYLAITPDGEEKQVICDVHNFTHNTSDTNPDGITAYNPIKLYTSKELVSFMKSKGKTLQIYWDDLKLWVPKNQ